MKLKRIAAIALLALNGWAASAQSWFTPDVEKRVNELLSQMTVEEKLAYIGGVDWMYTKNIDRLGIPRMKMSDGPQGLGTHGKSTAYPSLVSLAAAWNEDLALQYGISLGRDCRARGVNILLGPSVNIYRAPFCGRNFEYMGEDPYLTARTAVGYIKGVQSQGIMAVIKHFACNNSDYDRDHISNDIDERTLHEIYFPAFKAAVQEAEVGSVMSSYNLLNGIYCFYRGWYYHDSNDGKMANTGELYLRTGIGIKKFVHPEDSKMNEGHWVPKIDTAIRYAEVLLIYAEALNELDGKYEIESWDGTQTYTIQRNVEEMSKSIEPIRIRAGLPNYSQEVYASKDEFRKKLKRDRQIELFAEGHRYYDLRRWKDAPEEESTMIYGCNINISQANRDLFYIPTVVPSLPAVFAKKMYFWPISHNELRKNIRLTQNPGWTYYD